MGASGCGCVPGCARHLAAAGLVPAGDGAGGGGRSAIVGVPLRASRSASRFLRSCSAADRAGRAAPLWVAALVVGAFAIFPVIPTARRLIAMRRGGLYAGLRDRHRRAASLRHRLGLLSRWRSGRMAGARAGGAIAMAGVIFLSRLA